ncbi:flagellar filament capping protein FliD [Stakelama tenebrarum]|uniref:Flagellar hook-associated protein 2 n=1 Tax=Stakelama tenebrarum TaxID=2711215 RepID=A0A6G6Y1B6_9SPHN|nr:flagellar filament capping protein FliD [Sphingosinithalassobacter tenebrarum]QIG78734.1 flagellar filament capping protein FliD [Sphingosinithalassobacter tenebrarum]
MPTASIISTLGAGSGIDTKQLVSDLVDAQYAAQTAKYETNSEKLEAQISSVGELLSGITGFSNALKSRASDGSLTTQPTVSDSSILSVSAQSGAALKGLDTQIEVRQLASAQVSSSEVIADPQAHIGTGTLTLAFGTAEVADGEMTGFTPGATSVDIAIGEEDGSLQGIADAINAADAGVTASILTDADGARLVLKSATGAAQAFTLTATETEGDEGLAALNVGVGATGTSIGTAAADAIVAVDGVAVRRSTNSMGDLIPGVDIDLARASPGTLVKLGVRQPTAALSGIVSDFVDTFNEYLGMVREATDPSSGTLASDSAVRTLSRSLGGMTLQKLVPDAAPGVPSTLAEIGVATNRDGTLSIDAERLAAVLASNPQAVEKMFSASAGLPKKLAEIADAAANAKTGLAASETRFNDRQEELDESREKALADAETMRTRLTQQYAAMEARVASYRSTQDFLKQQVDAWNGAND